MIQWKGGRSLAHLSVQISVTLFPNSTAVPTAACTVVVVIVVVDGGSCVG